MSWDRDRILEMLPKDGSSIVANGMPFEGGWVDTGAFWRNLVSLFLDGVIHLEKRGNLMWARRVV